MTTTETPEAPAATSAFGQFNQRRRAAAESIRVRWRALPKWGRLLFVLAFVAFLYYLPWLGYLPGGTPPRNPTAGIQIPPFNFLRTDMTSGGAPWAAVLFTCTLYVLIAVGLNVVIGLAGLLDLGYIGFFAVGAYTVAVFGSTQSPVVQALQRRFDLGQNWAVAWALCIPIVLVLVMSSGVLLGGPTLRLRGDYLAIVTLGFGEIIRITARNLDGSSGPDITHGNRGLAGIPGPQGAPSADNHIFGLTDLKPWYWLALSVVILLILGVRRLEHSRVGRAWLAIREDEDAAGIMGVQGFKYKLWAFAIGACLGGVAGLLFASRYNYISPNQFDAQTSILFVAMVVIGGSGNMLGVSIGAILIVYLPERFREVAEWRWVFFSLAMVLIMILRPQGIIPSRRRARELADRRQEAPTNV